MCIRDRGQAAGSGHDALNEGLCLGHHLLILLARVVPAVVVLEPGGQREARHPFAHHHRGGFPAALLRGQPAYIEEVPRAVNREIDVPVPAHGVDELEVIALDRIHGQRERVRFVGLESQAFRAEFEGVLPQDPLLLQAHEVVFGHDPHPAAALGDVDGRVLGKLAKAQARRVKPAQPDLIRPARRNDPVAHRQPQHLARRVGDGVRDDDTARRALEPRPFIGFRQPFGAFLEFLRAADVAFHAVGRPFGLQDHAGQRDARLGFPAGLPGALAGAVQFIEAHAPVLGIRERGLKVIRFAADVDADAAAGRNAHRVAFARNRDARDGPPLDQVRRTQRPDLPPGHGAHAQVVDDQLHALGRRAVPIVRNGRVGDRQLVSPAQRNVADVQQIPVPLIAIREHGLELGFRRAEECLQAGQPRPRFEQVDQRIPGTARLEDAPPVENSRLARAGPGIERRAVQRNGQVIVPPGVLRGVQTRPEPQARRFTLLQFHAGKRQRSACRGGVDGQKHRRAGMPQLPPRYRRRLGLGRHRTRSPQHQTHHHRRRALHGHASSLLAVIRYKTRLARSPEQHSEAPPHGARTRPRDHANGPFGAA